MTPQNAGKSDREWSKSDAIEVFGHTKLPSQFICARKCAISIAFILLVGLWALWFSYDDFAIIHVATSDDYIAKAGITGYGLGRAGYGLGFSSGSIFGIIVVLSISGIREGFKIW